MGDYHPDHKGDNNDKADDIYKDIRNSNSNSTDSNNSSSTNGILKINDW